MVNIGYRHGLPVDPAVEGIDKPQILVANQRQGFASHLGVKYIALRFDGSQRKGNLLAIEVDTIDVGFIG